MAFCGYLRQSTSVDILLGPFMDDADGDTPDTDATIDVEISKNGQALADSESAAPTHDAAGDVDGYYNCVLGTTDTNTLGILTVVAHHADDLPVRQDYQVVTANVWNTMCSTDKYDVNVAEVTAGIIANASFNADVGSTAHGTNIIALAVRKILEELNLDHLLKVTTGVAADSDLEAYVVAGTVLAHLMAAGADVTAFKPSTDSLEAIKVHADTIKAETASIQTETTALDTLTKAAGDGDLAAILGDTNAIQGKLPTNKFMGSSDGADDDGTLNTINTNAARLTAERAAVLTDWINAGRLDALLDLILEDTGTTLDALVKDVPTVAEFEARSDVAGTAATPAEVNTEVLDVLNTDTFAEPGQEAPAATTTLADKIGYLYKFLRNKVTNDGTNIKVYNDAGAVVDQKNTVSESEGTVTRGEFGTGP